MSALIESKMISEKSRVLFVNDGSKDKTWEIIQKLNKEDKLFTGVTLSRNRGHQNALIAGLTTANKYADMTISLDADLQDDINAIDKMVEEYHNGYDVVYGVRSSRAKDTKFKKGTAEAFYKIMKKMGVDTVFNHADYRLLSKVALENVLKFTESNLFLRGIVPQVGFKSTKVEYERGERFAGESKYPLKKMLNFAIDGITSFSIKPLFLILTLGIILGVVGFVAFVTTLVLAYTVYISSIWAILSFITLMTGGIIACIGLVGIYVGKSYMETKHRPRFIIEKELD
jgi:glycosyltransferase involved in cell wall biosynthesis